MLAPAHLQMDAPKIAGGSLFNNRAERIQERLRFYRSRTVERSYAARLIQVAKQIGEIVKAYAPKGLLDLSEFVHLQDMLIKYGQLLNPWAQRVAANMVNEVARKDADAWAEHGKKMGRALRKEIQSAPTGEALRKFMAEQVDLITSLPRDAAQRVHKLTLEGITNGSRADSISREIERSGHVTASRAKLIARTEVARTASGLTMVRAQYVGSTHYVWETAQDSDVRPIHRQLQGKVIAFDDPPVADESGVRAHAGMIWNCRCYISPVINDLTIQ